VVSFILFLNRFFRRPNVGGRESQEAYSTWENEWGGELARLYLEPAGDITSKKILDVGCGLGGKTISYGEGGASEVFGTDKSIDNLQASCRYASIKERSFLWAFFAGDASSLPVCDNAFDTVIANDAMEHFADPGGALAEIQRVVKIGGSIWLFFTPHFSPLGSHLYDYIYIPWCHLLFTRRQIREAIRRVLQGRMSSSSEEEIDDKIKEIMRSYDEDLNHMSVGRFFSLLKRFPKLSATYIKLEPAKFRALKTLTYLPLVRELFTGTVICKLVRIG
jgi:ubiquinone/menaquinone biosynthesis C-methylase UbiE